MRMNLGPDWLSEKCFSCRCKMELSMLNCSMPSTYAELTRETVLNEVRLGFSEADARANVELVPELDGAVD